MTVEAVGTDKSFQRVKLELTTATFDRFKPEDKALRARLMQAGLVIVNLMVNSASGKGVQINGTLPPDKDIASWVADNNLGDLVKTIQLDTSRTGPRDPIIEI